MEEMMEGPELLPCPFCGGMAWPKQIKYFGRAYQVVCEEDHSNGLFYINKASAIAAWNRRADLAALRALAGEGGR